LPLQLQLQLQLQLVLAFVVAVAFNPVDRAVSPGPEADKVRRLFERSAA